MDDVSQWLASMGQGTILAKMYIDSAYRIVPVHSGDGPLLGMMWKGGIFFFSSTCKFLPGVPGQTSVDLSCSLNLLLELIHIFTHLFLTLSANGIVYRNM